MLFVNLIVQTKTVCFGVLITCQYFYNSKQTSYCAFFTRWNLPNTVDYLPIRHNYDINRENLVNNTDILLKHSDNFRMLVHEALRIKFNNPLLNRQTLEFCSFTHNYNAIILFFNVVLLLYLFTSVVMIPATPTYLNNIHASFATSS